MPFRLSPVPILRLSVDKDRLSGRRIGPESSCRTVLNDPLRLRAFFMVKDFLSAIQFASRKPVECYCWRACQNQ